MTVDDLSFTSSGVVFRRIFEGHQTLSKEENAKLDALMEIAKKNEITFKDKV